MSSAQENEREVSGSVPLEEIERSGKPAFVLSLTEVKLLGECKLHVHCAGSSVNSDTGLIGIAGVGFFLDGILPIFLHPFSC